MSTQIDQKVLDLSEKLKNEMKIGEQGIVEVPKDVYESTLEGTGLTMEVVKQVQGHTADMVSATGLALGELGIDAFKKDKDLDQVSVQIPVHKDDIAGVFSRSKQVPDGNGGMQAKHGVLNMRYTTAGAAGSKGSLKKVKAHLGELATGVLTS